MADIGNVKITVLKMLGTKELWGDEAPASGAADVCGHFKEVLHLGLGGKFFIDPGDFIISCCTDGMRPVFFRIERE